MEMYQFRAVQTLTVKSSLGKHTSLGRTISGAGQQLSKVKLVRPDGVQMKLPGDTLTEGTSAGNSKSTNA